VSASRHIVVARGVEAPVGGGQRTTSYRDGTHLSEVDDKFEITLDFFCFVFHFKKIMEEGWFYISSFK
jgi:hypothetical protein